MFKTFSKNRQCNLTMAQETIAYRHYFMAVPKKSPYVSELLQAYKQMNQSPVNVD